MLLNPGLLINAGQLTWSGSGSLSSLQNLYISGLITNLAAGTITLAADVSTAGGGTIGNAGLVRKTAGTNSTLNATFVNTGTVDVESGTLNLNNNSTQAGIVTNASGMTLNFINGTHSVVAGFSAPGPGSLVLSGGTVNFNNVAGTTLPNLTFTGGTVGGTGSLTINGPFNWSGGTINNNTGGVTLNGVSTSNGVGFEAMLLNPGLLINAGQLTWSGSGSLSSLQNLYISGLITNLAAGTITLAADVSTAGGGTIGNAGLLRKTAGTNSTLNAVLVNTGTVDLESGTLSLNNNSTQAGIVTNASGTTLNFINGTHSVVAGFSAPGPGSLVLSGGTVNFNNVAGTTLPNLTFTGGTVGGTGSLTINGPFNWSGGTINNNTGGVTLNGVSTLNGVGFQAMLLNPGLLINAGQLTWSGSGSLSSLQNLYISGLITNLAAGTITMAADVSTVNSGTIGNAGLIRKTAGTNSTLNAVLVNTGTVDLESGTLSLNNNSTQAGMVTNASGTTLNFINGTHSVVAGFSAPGPGSLVISGGTVNFNNVAGTTLPNLTFTGGTLGGTGSLTLNGPFNWSGGQINNNTGGVTLNGVSTLNGVGFEAMLLNPGLLINAGQLTWSGSGSLSSLQNLYISGLITNLAAGTITLAADVSTAGGGTIGNAGLLRKTAGTNSTLNGTFVNTGTLDAQSGTINLAGAHTLTKGTLNFGISSLTNFGTISLSGAAGLAGTVSANLNNGYIPIAPNSFAVLSYGSLTGLFTNAILPFADAWQTNYTSTNFTLTVLNARPILTAVTNQMVDELTTLIVTNSATDLDIPAQTLAFSLVSGTNGMVVNPANGVFTWTPQQTNSPSTNTVIVNVTDNGTPPLSVTNSFTVIVREVNVAPTLPVITDQTINELTLLTVTNTATEFNIHSTTIGYGLVNPPASMGITANGVITWTPAQTQSPGTNLITTIVTNSNPYDLINPQLISTNTFTVIVKEVNVAPSLPAILPQTVNELALLTVPNTATNSNIHSTIIGYALVNPPTGMGINPSGIITWTPSPVQSPGTNLITTIVTNSDPFDLINPQLTATNTFTVIVFAPTLAPIGNFAVNVGQTVSFTVSATDNDNIRTLTFSLGTAPGSATINPGTGVFNWRPPVTSAGSSNNIQVIVTDNSVPSLNATRSFYVLVNPLTSVTLVPVAMNAAQFQVQVTGPIGPDYILQANGSLANTNWLNLLTNTPVASPFNVTDTNAPAGNQFYRVKLSP